MDKTEKIKKIADHYGFAKQSNIAIEEMSELTKAICKWHRNRGDSLKSESYDCDERTAIIEEMADVWIMLCQLDYLLDSEFEVSEMITKKLDRQLDRIKRECVEKSTY